MTMSLMSVLFLLLTLANSTQSITCKPFADPSDVDFSLQKRNLLQNLSFSKISKCSRADKEYFEHTNKYLILLLSSKDLPEMQGKRSRCRSRVRLMNRVRYRYMTFEKLGKKNPNYQVIAKMSTCFYTTNNVDDCNSNFNLINYVEFDRLVSLQRLATKLDDYPIKNYMRTFRVRMRLYQKVSSVITVLKSMRISHCRLCMERLTIKIPSGFEDLPEDSRLSEKLSLDPLNALEFESNFDVKVLGAEYLVMKESCPDGLWNDSYFSYMTTYAEHAQQTHASFGTWELVMVLLQFEMRFLLNAETYYGQIDNQVVSRLKQIRIQDNLNYSQHSNASKNPLAPHYIHLMDMLYSMRSKSKLSNTELGRLLDDCFLKMYQIHEILEGNEPSKNMPKVSAASDDPYIQFIHLVKTNLVLNIKVRNTIPEVNNILDLVTFSQDTFHASMNLGSVTAQYLI